MSSLGEDIASIRKKEKLSIQDIFDTTRIPQNILKEIENGNIFKDSKRNKTYVRSFVRTYAKALKIAESDIIEALDDTYSGRYSGSLAKKYGLAQKGKPKESKEDRWPYKPTFQLEDTSEEEPPSSKESSSKKNEIDQSSKPSTDTPSKAKESESQKFTEYSLPDPKKEHNKATPEPPTVDKVNWVDMGKRVNSSGNHSMAPIFTAIIAIILIIIAYFVYVKFSSDGHNASSSKNQSLAVDSVATVQIKNPANAGLTSSETSKTSRFITATNPDTLSLTIYAAYGNLSPVRVQSDVANQLNPYWIPKGQAMKFQFVNKIAIKGKFSELLLLMNGHLISNKNQYLGSDKMIHLTRSIFEKNPKWLSPAPDTLQNGVPQPKVVKNRPIFP